MRLFSLFVFVVLQIVLLPFAVLGAVVVAYKQIFVSKRLGVSQTGIEILNGRWTMHIFGMRNDTPTAQLAAALPNTSTVGLWLSLFPLWVKYKLSGTYFVYPRVAQEGAEDLRDLVTARTLYFDRIIQRVVGDMDQFVLLGAGYDTRAYGALRRDGLAFFELDQVNTQALKIASLEDARIDTSHVSFVTVDFEKEDAFAKLEAAGYDQSKKTLFLWEGVTLYLTEEDVRGMLGDICRYAGPGSVVVADVYGERMLQRVSPRARKVLEYTDEALGFALPFATDAAPVLRDFLESEGMTQGESYFMGEADEKGPFMVVVEFGV